MMSILAIAGIVWVICFSRILKGVREWITIKSEFLGRLLSCWGCTSFWVGMIYYSLPNVLLIENVFSSLICCVFLQSLYDKLRQ
jgi:hypothetical protein